MKIFPLIVGLGSVTAVGLTAPQTCAAIRARISGFRDAVYGPPFDEPQVGAVVPAKSSLKYPVFNWLKNLATRAIQECLENENPVIGDTALLISMPEAFRHHPAFKESSGLDLFKAVEQRLEKKFHPESKILREGHAATLRAISIARELLVSRTVRYCVVGGVDSLVNQVDINRLKAANRLHGSDNPQGLIPGEAAAFILLTLPDRNLKCSPLAQILSVGTALEQDSVLGERYSVGKGLRKALVNATKEVALAEAKIDFLVSDMNGERFRAWESMICHSRFYRTRREYLNNWYPSASVGDIGAASGALLISIAAMAISRGYAPGKIAMCESSSEEGLRAACIVGGH